MRVGITFLLVFFEANRYVMFNNMIHFCLFEIVVIRVSYLCYYTAHLYIVDSYSCQNVQIRGLAYNENL